MNLQRCYDSTHIHSRKCVVSCRTRRWKTLATARCKSPKCACPVSDLQADCSFASWPSHSAIVESRPSQLLLLVSFTDARAWKDRVSSSRPTRSFKTRDVTRAVRPLGPVSAMTVKMSSSSRRVHSTPRRSRLARTHPAPLLRLLHLSPLPRRARYPHSLTPHTPSTLP
jgi:hypothetical protein